MLQSLRNRFSLLGEFSLLRWFSALSLLCIVAAGSTSSYYLTEFLRKQMLQRDAAIMLEFVQSVTDIENVKSRAAGREPDVRDSQMKELFDHLIGVPYMLRTNIYAPDQTLVWSSEKELIGKRFDDNHELEEALHGKMEIETGRTDRQEHPKNEHMFLSGAPVDFVETYLPLRDKQTGRILGVAELYRVPSTLFETIRKGNQLIWTTAVLSGCVLFLILFSIVWHADKTIREQQARLIESETLAAVGEMGSAVAHGIRNPLASIRSSAELCIDGKESPAVRESANDIVAQVDRLEKWVRDLLSYAQPDPGVRSSVQLVKVIDQVCQHFKRDFEKLSIEPIVVVPESLPEVIGDPAALEQVFASLIANAVEAMPNGGQLKIAAHQSSRQKPVLVTVRDNGIGITDEQKAKLFQAFQTNKPKGMGLGLALVRRIMRRAGGDIRILSQSGAGTQVALTFATQAVSK